MSLSTIHSKLPKYARLAEELRQQISAGELNPGDRLPSFLEMRTQQGVSQGIMERAYALLEQDGLVERQPGRGTFVMEPVQKKATGILGLIMHAGAQDMTTPYTLHFLAGIRREAARHDLKIQWINPQDEKNISRENMDAVIMRCHPTEALALNLPADIPQVLLFYQTPDFPCVGMDDAGGVRLAVEHLLKLGHRNISCLAAVEQDSISRQRVAGYHAALKKAGISSKKTVEHLADLRSLGFLKSGEITMETWLKNGWKQLGCTAIVAHNDDTATGIIRALTHHGLRVPEDVSVIGFDGTEIGELCTPPLTSIKVPLEEIGEEAVKVLLEQMVNGIPSDPKRISLPAQLKIGESTAPVN